jgi:hypothetical protein
MSLTGWLPRRRFPSRSPVRTGKGKKLPQHTEVRPLLEILEDRLSPGTVALPNVTLPTTTTISAAAASFSLFNQTETVTTQTNFTGGGGVNGTTWPSTVQITDGARRKPCPSTRTVRPLPPSPSTCSRSCRPGFPR